MSAPARHDMRVWIGADFLEEYEAINEDGSVFDLTGSELVFRALDADGEELFRLSSETADSGLEITDGTGGEYSLALTADQTRTFELGRVCRYEIERRISGAQEKFMVGYLLGEGGANDD